MLIHKLQLIKSKMLLLISFKYNIKPRKTKSVIYKCYVVAQRFMWKKWCS